MLTMTVLRLARGVWFVMWPGSTRTRSLSVPLYTHRNLSQMKRAHHGPGTAQRAEHALSLSCLTGVSGNGGMTDPYRTKPKILY